MYIYCCLRRICMFPLFPIFEIENVKQTQYIVSLPNILSVTFLLPEQEEWWKSYKNRSFPDESVKVEAAKIALCA